MGLFLSTLVFCVGVIELITFFHNVRRHVEYPAANSNLSNIRDGYIQELRNTRRKLIEDLEKLKEADGNRSTEESSFVIPDSHATRGIPTFRLNSHEDIEIEYNDNVVRSKSSSPRRFLVTEKKGNVESSDSRRRFVVSEEPQPLKKSKSQTDLPEFLISESKHPEKSPDSPRYVLQDQAKAGDCPIPLPRQFIVSESELTTVLFQDEKVDSTNITEYIRRSPSPFPILEHPPNHRNSLCSELLDYLSLDSVQEEQKSRSPSPNVVIEHKLLEQKVIINNNDTVELVPPEKVEKSFHSLNDGNVIRRVVTDRIRSKSESDCSEPNSPRVLDTQLKTSSSSEINDYRKVLTKIELELEEALQETVLCNTASCSNSSDVEKQSSAKSTEKKNVSNNSELGTIS